MKALHLTLCSVLAAAAVGIAAAVLAGPAIADIASAGSVSKPFSYICVFISLLSLSILAISVRSLFIVRKEKLLQTANVILPLLILLPLTPLVLRSFSLGAGYNETVELCRGLAIISGMVAYVDLFCVSEESVDT